jgi:3-oxoacyl-[acyl-carrier-protein] synthase I
MRATGPKSGPTPYCAGEHFDPAMALHHPAEYYGDAGAAAGPIMTAMAAIGLRRAYLSGPVLIYASSDRGQCCALVITQ